MKNILHKKNNKTGPTGQKAGVRLRSASKKTARYGFIGFGNMGSVLLRSLLAYGALQPAEVAVTTRTKAKLAGLRRRYPALQIATNAQEVANLCDVVFICVKTGDARDVIAEIAPILSAKNSHLITLSAGIELINLEKIYPGPISKIIPTLIAEVGEGVTLICHNSKVSRKNKKTIEGLLHKIGKLKQISEDHFEIGADLTSCAPAFIAAIFEKFAEESMRRSNFSKEEALEIISHTLLGTARLLNEKKISYRELMANVATKGGITEQGLKVLDRELPRIFAKLFRVTLNRHEEIKKIIRQQFADANKRTN